MSEKLNLHKEPIEVPFAAEDTAPYIFISYAHDDKERVFPIIKRIYEKGWHIWFDQGIEINTDYNECIADHITGSAVVLLMVTERSAASKFVTKKEILYALNNDIKVILCMLDEAKLPSGIELNTADYDEYPRIRITEQPELELSPLYEALEWLERGEERIAKGVKINVPATDVQAENYVEGEDDYKFEQITNDTVRLTRYFGDDTVVIVPAVYKGMQVAELVGTFVRNENITDVTIPNSITSIGFAAFFGCAGLTSITIPDSVTSIGFGALEGCTALTIHCVPDSYAERYAKYYKIHFTADLQKTERTEFPKRDCNIPFRSDSKTPFAFCSYAHADKGTVFRLMDKLHREGCMLRYDELERNQPDCFMDILSSSCACVIVFLSAGYLADDARMTELITSANTGKELIVINLDGSSLPSDLALQRSGNQDYIISDKPESEIITGTVNHLNALGCCFRIEPIPFEYIAVDDKITLTRYIGNDAVVEIKEFYRKGQPTVAIGNSAFSSCTRLTGITIPDSVTSIGARAFDGCTALTNITIPDSVTNIGARAFGNCAELTSINIPNSVTIVGEYTFTDCTGLTSITIPDSVTSIGDSAFKNCTRLTSITIPDSVTSIGDSAFRDCTNLTNIAIPDSVTHIGIEAFYGCTELIAITVTEANPNYYDEDGVLFSKQNTLITYPIGKSTAIYTIPDSVTSIGQGAFYGCAELTDITIPDKVASIGNWAFKDCTGLTSITIPDSVTSISDSAFRDCTGLTDIAVSEGNPNYYDEDGVLFSKKNQLLLYPIAKYTSAYTIPDNVTSIEYAAFEGCTRLTSITIPDSVTSIGKDAFWGCTGVTDIVIPDRVTYIDKYAFQNCENLTVICSPGSYVWQYCEKNNISHKASKCKSHAIIIILAILTALAAGGAAVQLSGLFDILGWLVDLL